MACALCLIGYVSFERTFAKYCNWLSHSDVIYIHQTFVCCLRRISLPIYYLLTKHIKTNWYHNNIYHNKTLKLVVGQELLCDRVETLHHFEYSICHSQTKPNVVLLFTRLKDANSILIFSRRTIPKVDASQTFHTIYRCMYIYESDINWMWCGFTCFDIDLCVWIRQIIYIK